MVDFEQSRCFSTTAWRAALAGDNAVGPALCAAPLRARYRRSSYSRRRTNL